MKLSRYVIIALIATSLFSCKKNDDNKDCTLSEASLVGTYKIGTVTYKETASSPEVDVSSFAEACNLDDLETYKSDHTFVYTDAGVKCDPTDDNTAIWSLSGKTLKAGEDTGTITSFDCSGFTVTQSDYMKAGDSFIVTFTKQ
ncbi:MAG TPA: lipocalin family protein [Hanamia sp.]